MPPVDVSRPAPDTRFQQPVDPDPLTLLYPPAIPVPGTAPDSLQAAAGAIGTAASEVSRGANDVKTSWEGLQPHYSAPEAEDLFSVMNLVAQKGDTIQDDLADAVGALEDFAEAAAEAKRTLRSLKDQAWDFYEENKDEEHWALNPWKVGQNRGLKLAVNRAWATFQEAERECANRLVAVHGGDTTYTAASAGEPGANEIVHGIDPDDVPETAYDLTSFDDWQRLWEDADYIARNSAKPWPLDWTVDAYYANWDNFGGGMVWDTAVSAVASTGMWREGRGWADTPGEVWDNALQHQEEKVEGLAALAGFYGEDEWMNPFSGPDAWNWEGDTWWDNVSSSWTEVGHDFVPWREWDDRPAYVVYTGAGNVALTAVAFPVRGGTILARLSNGDLLDGAGGRLPDDVSPGDMPTHWENGTASLADFDLPEHLSRDGEGHSGATSSIDRLLRRLSADFEARLGDLTGTGGGRSGDAPAGAPDRDASSPAPVTAAPDRGDSADSSSGRGEDDEVVDRQAQELVTEVEEYLRENQPALVGAGARMDVGARTDMTVTNSAGDGGGAREFTGGSGNQGNTGGTTLVDSGGPRGGNGHGGDDPRSTLSGPGEGQGPGSDNLRHREDASESASQNNSGGTNRPPQFRPLDRNSTDSEVTKLIPEEGQRFGEGVSLDPDTRYRVWETDGRWTDYITDSNGKITEIRAASKGWNTKHPEFLNPRRDMTYVVDQYTFRTDDQGRTVSAEGTLSQQTNERNDHRQTAVGGQGRRYFQLLNEQIRKDFIEVEKREPEPGEVPQYQDIQYDGGHLIGSQYYGIGDPLNMVPMRFDVNQNRTATALGDKDPNALGGIDGAFYNVERAWRGILTQKEKWHLFNNSNFNDGSWKAALALNPKNPKIDVKITNIYDPNLPPIKDPKTGRIVPSPPVEVQVRWSINGRKIKKTQTYNNLPPLE
ncbi:DNA/RNA non-specific endonuclease [Nocardiopsis sp. EMB25]|uniref:DNA/RNA non-specific endonuclease n=1 Tax=Nocardiopsis sp. EMB25 TaxID=2835867 RepID=UPI002284891A|nr:DNA/RNA non-specific endonuclease [Nocardiopsis sp. EMB25]MCY9787065.1 DNA/RNA non-specific endonuclease [Nocardiopsis sp. EMB25]